jgi:hypothetical protein
MGFCQLKCVSARTHRLLILRRSHVCRDRNAFPSWEISNSLQHVLISNWVFHHEYVQSSDWLHHTQHITFTRGSPGESAVSMGDEGFLSTVQKARYGTRVISREPRPLQH